MSKIHAMKAARFALIFHGTDLPMDQISQLLDLQPTRCVRAGELLNRLPELRAEDDEWIYAIDLNAPMGEDQALNQILQHLIERSCSLHMAESLGRLTLRLHIESDYAQMVYTLMPETIHRLMEIGLPLEVTSLSWGEIGI